MNLSHLTSDTLRNLIPLTEKRDELIQNLRSLESDIAAALTGTATTVVKIVVPAKTETKAKAPKRVAKGRFGRGRLKEQILALLETAGEAGLGVKEIADKLGVKAGNIYVWFSSTGKALTTKVSPGRFAVNKSPSPLASKETKTERKPPVAKATKPANATRNISPEARAKMASAAKTRWEKQRAAKEVSTRSVHAKPAKAKKSGKPAKKATKNVKKGFKLPAPE